jgi:hypothetical protein
MNPPRGQPPQKHWLDLDFRRPPAPNCPPAGLPDPRAEMVRGRTNQHCRRNSNRVAPRPGRLTSPIQGQPSRTLITVISNHPAMPACPHCQTRMKFVRRIEIDPEIFVFYFVRCKHAETRVQAASEAEERAA